MILKFKRQSIYIDVESAVLDLFREPKARQVPLPSSTISKSTFARDRIPETCCLSRVETGGYCEVHPESWWSL